MTSSGPPSPPRVGDGDDTRARERMEQELEAVRRQLEMANTQIRTLEEELAETQETYRRSLEEKDQEVSQLKEKVKDRKEQYGALWRMNCSQLIEYDETMANKEEELQALRDRVTTLERAHADKPLLHLDL